MLQADGGFSSVPYATTVTTSTLPPQQSQNRAAFGKAVLHWMQANDISQQNMHDFATAAETNGPWNSSISLLQRGKLDPKAQFWVAFGQLNAQIATGDLSYMINRKLKDTLIAAEPFRTADGSVATAVDLYAMFIGECRWLPQYNNPLPEKPNPKVEKLVKQVNNLTDKEREALINALSKN